MAKSNILDSFNLEIEAVIKQSKLDKSKFTEDQFKSILEFAKLLKVQSELQSVASSIAQIQQLQIDSKVAGQPAENAIHKFITTSSAYVNKIMTEMSFSELNKKSGMGTITELNYVEGSHAIN